jgi:predicted RNA binding protein YcfA (HicA-like mRNA interferase family)
MGRLAGFKYRQIVKRLKRLGFVFDRQAAGSHEIWYTQTQIFTPLFPIIQETCQKEHCELS